jgi:atypical dual specificity phosphatase
MSYEHARPSHYGHGSQYEERRLDSTNRHDDHFHDSDKMFGSFLPSVAALTLRATLGVTVVLYILNQQHLLPRTLSSMVSKALFWPTLPITISKRVGRWLTPIDDTVIMGGIPFGFLGYPKRLREQYNVKGVINLCEEYRGPLKQYNELGMEELYLPTTDHFEPSQEDMLSALSFMKRHQAMGQKVYVHCRAGHGRSGAVVFAWMMLHQNHSPPTTKCDLEKLNADFCKIRNVRKSLWKQPNLQALHRRFLKTGGVLENVHDTFFQSEHDEQEENGEKEIEEEVEEVLTKVDKKDL